VGSRSTVNISEIIERKFPGAVEVEAGKYAALAEDREHYLIVSEAEAVKPHGPHAVLDMPAWWVPGRRYAVRNINTGNIVPDAVLRGSPLAYQGVTVDLDTGALIDADLSKVPREQFTHVGA
jgi:hypothetical protein